MVFENWNVLLVYVVAAIIISVLVYELTSLFLQTGGLNFDKEFVKDTVSITLGYLAGVLVGGFVFLKLSNREDLNEKSRKAFDAIRNNIVKFYWKNILLFVLMGLVSKVTKNLLDAFDNETTLNSLFSNTSLAEYAGVILAMVVFAVMFTYGLKKQLELKSEE